MAAKLYMYDAAYAPPLRKVIKAGGIAMNGYLTGDYANTTTQPADARKAGLGFVATYEEGRSELVRASRAAGRRVGDKIIAAFKAKGIPIRPDIAVYPSVDVSVPIDGNDHDADQCNDGWQGIRDVLDGDLSLRSYAEGAVIDALATARLVDGKCWLAAPTSWPGYRVDDKNVCVIQLVGTPVGGTDQNHIITDPHDLGAWWPDNSPYAQEANPLAAGDLTKRQLQQIQAAVWGYDHIPVAGDPKNPTWAPTSIMQYLYAHNLQTLQAVQALAKAVQASDGVLPRVASVQAQLAAIAKQLNALAAEVQALQEKGVELHLDTTTVPVTGTVQIGGTQ